MNLFAYLAFFLQRARFELKQMASRPFSKCLLDLTSNPVKIVQPSIVDADQVKLTKKKRVNREFHFFDSL